MALPTPIYANNVASLTAALVGPSDTALILVSATSFPSPLTLQYYFITVVHPTTGVVEVMKVTAKGGNTLTVTRGQDGTSATSFPSGSVVEMRVTAQVLRDLDFRTSMAIANGLATLDGTLKLTASQLPTNVPTLTGGKLDIAVIPDAIATDTELALKAPLAAPVLTGLAKAASLVVNEVGNTTDYLQVGNNARLYDGAAANAIHLKGIEDPTIGYFKFGNQTGGFGWNGTALVWGSNDIWHEGNFNPATKLNVASPSATGNFVTTGNIKCNQNYESTGGAVVLATTGSGVVYLRPQGAGTSAGEATVNAAGLFSAVDVQSYSDRELKDGLSRLTFREDLADQIELWSFFWKGTGAPGRGPVAQEVQEYAPDFVGRGGNGFLSIDKAGLALASLPGLAARLRRIEAALNLKVEPCSPVN
jgi:hypothetical protein